jgi:uncharacterized RDD family membrane protein YckC
MGDSPVDPRSVEIPEPEPATAEPQLRAQDVALGAVVAGGRAARAAGRLTLLPLRLAGRAPVVGPVLRRAGAGLAATGQDAQADARAQAEAVAGEVLAAPELGRTVDRALAGPLTDSVGRSLAEHRVVDRIAPEVLASADFKDALAAALENESTERAVEQALASPRVEALVADLLESRYVERTVGRVAASPELRDALGQQTKSLGVELASRVRRRAEGVDDAVERVARRWLSRPRPDAGAVPFGGLLARAIAFAIDLGIASLIALAVTGFLALVTSLVGDLRPAWLFGTLIGSGWGLLVGAYLVLFWTVVGETPGMRVMSLRLATGHGEPPGFARSLLRLLGLVLAIIPMFLGFLSALLDDRRRALPDFMAGTAVVRTDSPAPAGSGAPLGEAAPTIRAQPQSGG